MKRVLFVMLLTLSLVSVVAAAGAPPGMEGALPLNAKVVVTHEADLTGDGRPELIVGYAMPTGTNTRPPTEGRAAVLERTPAGDYRRFDLQGGWPGHYPPHFTVTDLTGDGRPELVLKVAGGGAWGMVHVFRRAGPGYERLLWDAAQDHVLWDADGDVRREIIARYRVGSQADQAHQRFIWKDGRFVAWHAPEWFADDWPVKGEAVPDLRGLTLKQAEGALAGAGLNLGVIAELDAPGAPGRVLRYGGEGMVHVAVGAGDPRFSAQGFPQVDQVLYQAGFGSGAAPAAATGARADAWQRWLDPLVNGVQQVVHTRFLVPPAYVLRLSRPWEVSLGGKGMAVRWVGVGAEPPHRGLLYLASGEPRPGHDWPPFKEALYTRADVLPLPVPPARPLAQYLREQPELDAFVTDRPEAWEDAVSARGIKKEGWPAPQVGPHLEGHSAPDPEAVPDPDHLLVAVLNGFVRRAERKGDDIHVEVAAAPGRAYRWILPLTGFNRSTRLVRVHLHLPGQPPKLREIALDAWHSWSGDPGPGSLIPEERGTRP